MPSPEGGGICLDPCTRPLVGYIRTPAPSSCHLVICNTIFSHVVYGPPKVYLPVLKMAILGSFKSIYIHIFSIVYIVDVR